MLTQLGKYMICTYTQPRLDAEHEYRKMERNIDPSHSMLLLSGAFTGTPVVGSTSNGRCGIKTPLTTEPRCGNADCAAEEA
jgi:hypothetical protein